MNVVGDEIFAVSLLGVHSLHMKHFCGAALVVKYCILIDNTVLCHLQKQVWIVDISCTMH